MRLSESLSSIVVEPGSTRRIDVSAWRTSKPVIKYESCTNCLICWIYCPEPAVLLDTSGKVVIDYMHCKGCGICAAECPKKAIVMEREVE